MSSNSRAILLSAVILLTFVLFTFASQAPFVTQQFPSVPIQLDTVDELTFHSQQIPVRSGDTLLEFQGHFICSEGTPCENQWTFVWTGFDRSKIDNIVLSSVSLYFYDLNTYTTTPIVLETPSDLDSFSATIDFPQTPNSLYSIYGYILYSTPITPDIDQMLLQSEMTIKTSGSSRYRFVLIPVIFHPFSIDSTPSNVLPTASLSDSASTQPKSEISSITLTPRALPTTQDTKAAFTPHYVYLSPTITFKSPFLNLSPAQRDTAFDPQSPQLFNAIHIELFGYSKWIEESKLTTADSTAASPYQFTQNCYINDVPVHAVILIASQSQVLSLSISSFAYQSVFIPMIQNNQTHAAVQCNGNFWMYYHPVNYLPAGCPQDTSTAKTQTTVSDPLIPFESMAIYFMNIETANDETSTASVSSPVESTSGATWLLIADRFQLSNTMYYCTEEQSFATPFLNLLTSQIVSNDQLDLPWEETVPSYQKSWVKCTYSLDFTDNFTMQDFDPKNNDIIISIQSSLRYVQSKSYTNENDINTSAPLQKALLLISPPMDIRKQYDAKSMLLTLPLQYTVHPSIINPDTQQPYISSENEYTTATATVLTDNFQQMFPQSILRNITDYSYLNKQLYTLYYPVGINEMKYIESDSIQCGLDISLDWNHHFDDGSDSTFKSLQSKYYNSYIPLIPQVVYPTIDTTPNNDDLDLMVAKPLFSDFPQDASTPVEWIDFSNSPNTSLVVSLNFTLFEETTTQQIDFLSLHLIDGIAFFKYSIPQNQTSICTTNYPEWSVTPDIATSSQDTLHLQFIYNTPTPDAPFHANKLDNFTITCPTILFNSASVYYETIKNGTASVDRLDSFSKFGIVNTILTHFQYRNETHYSIYQYNLENPFGADVTRKLSRTTIIILCSLAGLFALLIIVAVICAMCKRRAHIPVSNLNNTQANVHIDPNSYGGYTPPANDAYSGKYTSLRN